MTDFKLVPNLHSDGTVLTIIFQERFASYIEAEEARIRGKYYFTSRVSINLPQAISRLSGTTSMHLILLNL
jgi:hypothetical protein